MEIVYEGIYQGEKICFTNQISDYEIQTMIGKGACSAVFKAKCKICGCKVAIKESSKKQLKKKKNTNRLQNEIKVISHFSQLLIYDIQLHQLLNHPHVIKMFGHFEDDVSHYMILELCERGELFTYLKSQGRLKEKEIIKHGYQLAKALEYLHKLKIMHRDLKLGNILLNDDDTIKLCDFGLAVQLTDLQEERETLCGTPNYISPEILNRTPYSFKVDYWAFGCILYALATGQPPFESRSVRQTLLKVKNKKFDLPSNISENMKSLLRNLINWNTEQRYDIEDILKHHLFKKAEIEYKKTMKSIIENDKNDQFEESEFSFKGSQMMVTQQKHKKFKSIYPDYLTKFSRIQSKTQKKKKEPEIIMQVPTHRKTKTNYMPFTQQFQQNSFTKKTQRNHFTTPKPMNFSKIEKTPKPRLDLDYRPIDNPSGIIPPKSQIEGANGQMGVNINTPQPNQAMIDQKNNLMMYNGDFTPKPFLIHQQIQHQTPFVKHSSNHMHSRKHQSVTTNSKNYNYQQKNRSIFGECSPMTIQELHTAKRKDGSFNLLSTNQKNAIQKYTKTYSKENTSNNIIFKDSASKFSKKPRQRYSAKDYLQQEQDIQSTVQTKKCRSGKCRLQPLSTKGLKPRKMITKHATIQIKSDNSLIIDSSATQRVIKISSDGLQILVKKNFVRKGEKKQRLYKLKELPKKYHSIYEYGKKVIEIIKQKTFDKKKIQNNYGIFYITKQEGRQVFYGTFTNGYKIRHYLKSNEMKIQDPNGYRIKVPINKKDELVDGVIGNVISLAMTQLKRCLNK